jgi:hypothetical protein
LEERDFGLEQGTSGCAEEQGQEDSGEGHEEAAVYHATSVQDDVAVDESVTFVFGSASSDVADSRWYVWSKPNRVFSGCGIHTSGADNQSPIQFSFLVVSALQPSFRNSFSTRLKADRGE